jgi:tetratricopeptide (TPR) repeat protein
VVLGSANRPSPALAIREKTLGPDHADVAASLNNLAGVYRKEGRNAEAGPLYERALAIFEKSLDSDDPEIATVLNNLAALYQDEGRYNDAESVYTRSVAILEKAGGPGTPMLRQASTTWVRSTEAKAAMPTPSRYTLAR